MEPTKNIVKFSSLKLYQNHNDTFQRPHFSAETARLSWSVRAESLYAEMNGLEGRQQDAMKQSVSRTPCSGAEPGSPAFRSDWGWENNQEPPISWSALVFSLPEELEEDVVTSGVK